VTRPKSRTGRTPRQPKNVRLLLVTGIPATGKTTVATELQKTHGFKHLDFESVTLWACMRNGVDLDLSAVNRLKREGRNVIISWGFVPDTQLQAILALRALGFRWTWFDGDCDAALSHYLALGRSRSDWDRQLAKIQSHIDPRLMELGATTITTFTESGERRPLDEVVADVLR
jgi:hypothetical protein